jgi:hypothetical protein
LLTSFEGAHKDAQPIKRTATVGRLVGLDALSSKGRVMERIAQCHCGSLRAVVSGEPALSYVCHCKACQHRTGTAVHFGAYFPKERVRPEGPSKVYSRIADTGFAIHFHFCPTCGTSLYWISDKRSEHCGVAVGCFADPSFPAPTLSCWEESRHPWLSVPPNTEHFELGIRADGSPMTR